MCRDQNAAINILKKGLATVGHTGSSVRLRSPSAVEVNASGESPSTLFGLVLLEQGPSMNEESPRRDSWGVSKA